MALAKNSQKTFEYKHCPERRCSERFCRRAALVSHRTGRSMAKVKIQPGVLIASFKDGGKRALSRALTGPIGPGAISFLL